MGKDNLKLSTTSRRPNSISVKLMAVTSQPKMVISVERSNRNRLRCLKISLNGCELIGFLLKINNDKLINLSKKRCKGLKRNRVWSVLRWKMIFFGESLPLGATVQQPKLPHLDIAEVPHGFSKQQIAPNDKSEKDITSVDSVMLVRSWFQCFFPSCPGRSDELNKPLKQKRCDSFLWK